MGDNFDSDDMPSKQEIIETLGKKSKPKIKTPLLKVHRLRTMIIVISIASLIIVGGVFSFSNSTRQFFTGAVVGSSDFSASILGFFIGDEPLPESEKFGIKITGQAIDLEQEEHSLQTSLRTNYTSKCTAEKLDVKKVTETKMTTICDNEKSLLQEDITYWKEKYEACDDGN